MQGMRRERYLVEHGWRLYVPHPSGPGPFQGDQLPV